MIHVERDGGVEGQYVDYGIMKVHKTADAGMLVLTQQEFAQRQGHQDTVDALADSATHLQSKIDQVKSCLTERTSSSDADALMALIGKLESIVAVGAVAEDFVPVAAAQSSSAAAPAAAAPAASAAVVSNDASSEKVATLQAELEDAQKTNRAYSAYVAQLEASVAGGVPIMSAGAIVKRAESFANGELTVANTMSPVKQRMAARRMEKHASKSPEASKKWSALLKGIGKDTGAELSPLKKKLQERRKAKAAGTKQAPPVMTPP